MNTVATSTGWSVPNVPPGRLDPPLTHRFRAMATDVEFRVVGPTSGAAEALRRAEAVFRRVEAACTRFEADSPLMRANAAAMTWCEVPIECVRAVAEAARAHLETDGVFDPRVLAALVASGYDRSLTFEDGDVRVASASAAPVPSPVGAFWRPGIDEERSAVRIGPDPIDLGGIGKGLAVRWALAELRDHGRAVLVEAGGDCATSGDGPTGDGWSVGVEDPFGATEPSGGAEPIAVLAVLDAACATSSIRIRHWQVDGRPAHHLIDPRTGASGGRGLRAVTVVDPDPAHAEVWSKTLFLLAADRIAEAAEARAISALWVTEDGEPHRSEAMEPFLTWERPVSVGRASAG